MEAEVDVVRRDGDHGIAVGLEGLAIGHFSDAQSAATACRASLSRPSGYQLIRLFVQMYPGPSNAIPADRRS